MLTGTVHPVLPCPIVYQEPLLPFVRHPMLFLLVLDLSLLMLHDKLVSEHVLTSWVLPDCLPVQGQGENVCMNAFVCTPNSLIALLGFGDGMAGAN
jgi:hypothetical protein